MSQEVQFRAVKTGNMAEIPPDLPKGEWLGLCKVKKGATSKDQYPMLILEWSAIEANTDGNEGYVGKTVADFLTFFPEEHRASKMGKLKLKSLCEAFEIAIPAVSEIESWDDIEEFVSELDGLKGKFFTTIEQNKESGEMQTRVLYAQPKLRGLSVVKDEDDEAPATAKKGAKAPVKKTGSSRR